MDYQALNLKLAEYIMGQLYPSASPTQPSFKGSKRTVIDSRDYNAHVSATYTEWIKHRSRYSDRDIIPRKEEIVNLL